MTNRDDWYVYINDSAFSCDLSRIQLPKPGPINHIMEESASLLINLNFNFQEDLYPLGLKYKYFIFHNDFYLQTDGVSNLKDLKGSQLPAI